MKPPLRIHPTVESSVRHAREMRRDSTDAERRLWSYLRARRMNEIKFRRQHPIDPFIVDFCCVEKKPVVELDGGQHLENQQYDARRTDVLHERGYRVIRFLYWEVFSNIEGVLQQIASELSQ